MNDRSAAGKEIGGQPCAAAQVDDPVARPGIDALAHPPEPPTVAAEIPVAQHRLVILVAVLLGGVFRIRRVNVGGLGSQDSVSHRFLLTRRMSDPPASACVKS